MPTRSRRQPCGMNSPKRMAATLRPPARSLVRKRRAAAVKTRPSRVRAADDVLRYVRFVPAEPTPRIDPALVPSLEIVEDALQRADESYRDRANSLDIPEFRSTTATSCV